MGQTQPFITQSIRNVQLSLKQSSFIVLAPPLFAIAFFALHFINRRLYIWLLEEWRPVEDLQFIFFALACWMAFRITRRLWLSHQRAFAVLYLLFCIAMLFIAGEEVSWGQPVFRRIFTWWPDRNALRDINAQGETTVHNMRAVQWIFNWFYLLLALYGTLSPLLVWVRHWQEDPRARLLVPPLITVPAFGIMAVFMITRVFIAPYTGLVNSQSYMRYKEVGELTLAFGLWIFTTMNWRRLSSSSV